MHNELDTKDSPTFCIFWYTFDPKMSVGCTMNWTLKILPRFVYLVYFCSLNECGMHSELDTKDYLTFCIFWYTFAPKMSVGCTMNWTLKIIPRFVKLLMQI